MLADLLALRRRRARPGRHRRPRHPDRRGHASRSAASIGALYASDDELAAALARGRRGRRGAAVADAAARGLRHRADLGDRRPGPHRQRHERRAERAGRLHRGGAVPARVHRRPPLGAPGHRRPGPVRAPTTASSPRAAPGSAPACCCTGWPRAPDPLVRSWRAACADPSGALDRGQQAFPDRQEQRDEPVVAADHLGHLPDLGRSGRPSPRTRSAAARSGRPAPAARPRRRRPRCRRPAAAGARPPGSRGTRACPRRRRPGRRPPSERRGSTSRARPRISRYRLAANPACGERLPGHPLVLRLHVDAGQHAVRAHAPEQPDAGGAAAGADLHHRAGADRRGARNRSAAPRPGDRRRCRPGLRRWRRAASSGRPRAGSRPRKPRVPRAASR